MENDEDPIGSVYQRLKTVDGPVINDTGGVKSTERLPPERPTVPPKQPKVPGILTK